MCAYIIIRESENPEDISEDVELMMEERVGVAAYVCERGDPYFR